MANGNQQMRNDNTTTPTMIVNLDKTISTRLMMVQNAVTFSGMLLLSSIVSLQFCWFLCLGPDKHHYSVQLQMMIGHWRSNHRRQCHHQHQWWWWRWVCSGECEEQSSGECPQWRPMLWTPPSSWSSWSWSWSWISSSQRWQHRTRSTQWRGWWRRGRQRRCCSPWIVHHREEYRRYDL